MSYYCGLDFAYAKNGLIILDKDCNIIRQELIITYPKQIDEVRLLYVQDKLAEYINEECVVYLEGLSFGSKGQTVSQMGALHYFTRIFLYKNNITFKIITPSQLKKFVTGKGNCKKDLILLNVYKKWGVEFSDDNLADAYSLARMALEDFNNESK